jgi:hypothetical protein
MRIVIGAMAHDTLQVWIDALLLPTVICNGIEKVQPAGVQRYQYVK